MVDMYNTNPPEMEGSVFIIDEELKKRALQEAQRMLENGEKTCVMSLNGDVSNGSLTISFENEGLMVLDTLDLDGKTIYVGLPAEITGVV